MGPISHALNQVQERIEKTARRSGRSFDDISLVAVSKGQSVDAIVEAYEAGQRDFGENYAQELVQKAVSLVHLEIRWHFIGRLQRNKVKLVAPIISWMESIDSLALAKAFIDRAASPPPFLIQVNIGNEPTKSGIQPEAVRTFLQEAETAKIISFRGLMCIPPFDLHPEKSRPFYRHMRCLRDELEKEHATLQELSMGMSHDFEVAIEEGATIVRVGESIFGKRKKIPGPFGTGDLR